MSPNIASEDLRLFIDESQEVIETLEEALIAFERDGASTELMQEMFRAAHTLKGSSATAGFTEMASVTHHLENVLSLARDGLTVLDTESVGLLLEACDWLRAATWAVEASESMPESEALTARLEEVHPDTSFVQNGNERPKTAPKIIIPPEAAELERKLVQVSFDKDAQMVAVRMFQVIVMLEEVGAVCGSTPTIEDLETEEVNDRLLVYAATDYPNSELVDMVRSIEDVKDAEVSSWDAEDFSDNKSDVITDAGVSSVSSRTLGQTIRIDVNLIDSLMNLVGELIIDRTRLAQLIQTLSASGQADDLAGHLTTTVAHLHRITSEMQEGIMRARLMPLKNLTKKYPRMIRDLSIKTGKEVDFRTEGEDTELDRSVLEALDDPLIHLLRNCVDHGLEVAEQRTRARKPLVGKVRISASHEENHVVILVSDDGGGIDPESVRRAAVRKGLLAEDAAAHLTAEQAIELIFAPGFSTAKKVDETSGRGVGLDVVRTNLKRINATVSVKTEIGVGTTFELRLPLTLAIVKALLVTVDRDKYAIALSSVREVVEFDRSSLRSVNGREALMVRDRALPLLRLNRLFSRQHSDCRYAVVASSGSESVAFGVDSLIGEQEIVVKSLGRMLENLSGISGATILGAGDVALILDVESLLGAVVKNSGM